MKNKFREALLTILAGTSIMLMVLGFCLLDSENMTPAFVMSGIGLVGISFLLG